MSISFDGTSKIATLSAGTVTLSVIDLYSRWVDWIAVSDNSKYLPMFRTVGGDSIDAGAGTFIPAYSFLQNGWRIKPQEANHTLNITGGVLLVDGGGDPFINPTGSFTVRINYSQPVQAVTVNIGGGGGGGGGSSPTASDIAAAVWDSSVANYASAGTFGERVGRQLLTFAKFLGVK